MEREFTARHRDPGRDLRWKPIGDLLPDFVIARKKHLVSFFDKLQSVAHHFAGRTIATGPEFLLDAPLCFLVQVYGHGSSSTELLYSSDLRRALPVLSWRGVPNNRDAAITK